MIRRKKNGELVAVCEGCKRHRNGGDQKVRSFRQELRDAFWQIVWVGTRRPETWCLKCWGAGEQKTSA